MAQDMWPTTVKIGVFKRDLKILTKIKRCSNFEGQLTYSTGEVLQKKRHGHPTVVCSMEREISVHLYSCKGCVTVCGVVVRKWGTEEPCHSDSGNTAEEFWIRFLSLQAANAVFFSEAETRDRTFSLPSWPSLLNSEPSIALLEYTVVLQSSALLESSLLVTTNRYALYRLGD